jgi:hypothetical protein
MADFYIDPTNPNVGDGSIGNPFRSWASVTWGPNNRYFQKRGTTFFGQIVASQFGYTIGAYGVGANPRISFTGATQGAIYLSETNIVTLENFDVICSPDLTNAGIIALFQNNNSGRTFNIKNCNVYFGAIAFTQYQLGAGVGSDRTLVTIDGCKVYDSPDHGIAVAGKLVALIKNCKTFRCGQKIDRYGISLYSITDSVAFNEWTLVSGTIYSYTPTLASFDPGCTGTIYQISTASLASDTYGAFLTQNTATPTTPSVGQFGFSGGVIYVNLGVANTLFPQIWFCVDEVIGDIINCEVYFQRNLAVEGVAIAGDNAAKLVIRGCKAYNSQGPGYQIHRSRNAIVSGNFADTCQLGIRSVGTSGVSILNNTFVNMQTHGILAESGNTNNIISNNLIVNAPIGISAPASAICTTNAIINCPTPTTGGVTPTGTVTTLTNMANNYIPKATSSLAGAGTNRGFLRDCKGNSFNIPPSIGAYEV